MRVGTKIIKARKAAKRGLHSSREAAKMMQMLLAKMSRYDKMKEHFWAISLNTANFVTRIELVHIGTLSNSLVHPREVFRPAVIEAANSIIVVHNHPSGLVEPSDEDMNLYDRLSEAGKLLGIRLLDFLIIDSSKQYVSIVDRLQQNEEITPCIAAQRTEGGADVAAQP